tara:strand:+ start:112 stop:708 length:597 start_codon:yes stop_codon:yes gene_type:complete
MPQARLPDINTAYVKYRVEAIHALKKKEYNVMHGCIIAINALLPPEYQVIISTPDYTELSKAEITYKCSSCEEAIPKEDIIIFDLLPNSMQMLLHGRNANKVWNCIKCHKLNQLDSTKISQTVLQNPTFLGVVPESPARTNGLMDRMRFNIEIERWGWNILGELEFKMGQFRDDNWKRGDNDDISTSIDFSLDNKEQD